MNKKPIIQVENLTTRYGDTTILENVSFRVSRGEIFMLLGASGCGKSTLLKHLNGLLRPSSGRIIVNGTDITAADEETMRDIQRTIGVLFQADLDPGAAVLGGIHEKLPLGRRLWGGRVFLGGIAHRVTSLSLAMISFSLPAMFAAISCSPKSAGFGRYRIGSAPPGARGG